MLRQLISFFRLGHILRSHKTRTVVNRDLDPKDPPQQTIYRN